MLWGRLPVGAGGAAPASSPRPVTTLNDPGGNPASSARRASAKAVSDVSSAGFSTMALPIARAGATERPVICNG